MSELWMSFPHDPRDRVNAALRASDADRERITEILSAAFADGRLERDELDERMDAAASARTLGDLPPLVADLVPLKTPTIMPSRSLVGLSGNDLERRAQQSWEGRRRAAVLSFLGSALVLWSIWAAIKLGTDSVDFPWPLIVNALALLNIARVVVNREEIVRDEVHRLEKKQSRQQRWPKGLT